METTVYLHSNKETMYEKGEALGLEGDALGNFAHACYEVKIGLTVDTAGNASISTVDGFPLLKTLPSVPPSSEGSKSCSHPKCENSFDHIEHLTAAPPVSLPEGLDEARNILDTVIQDMKREGFFGYRSYLERVLVLMSPAPAAPGESSQGQAGVR